MRGSQIRLVWILLFLGVLFIPFYTGSILGDDDTGYVTVDSESPQWTYIGTANNSQIEWEIGGAFTANWTVNEANPDTYIIYWNQTGSNVTRDSGSYIDGQSVSSAYDPVLADVGNTIFFQLWLNDTFAQTNTSIVYFSVVNTNNPTVMITSPQNDTYTGNVTITLTSSSEDADTYWYAIYYANDTLHTGNTTWTESVEVALATAAYYLNAYMNDTAGLEDGEIVYFTVDLGVVTTTQSSGRWWVVSPKEPVEVSFLVQLLSFLLYEGFFSVVISLLALWVLLNYFQRDQRKGKKSV